MRGIAGNGSRQRNDRPAYRAAEFAVELNTAELLLLFGWFGPGPVLGVESLFQDLSLERVEAVHRAASMALRRRGVLRLDRDGKVAIHTRVEQLVRACYRPEHSLIVRSQEKYGPPGYQYVHFLGNLIVLHAQPNEGRHHLGRLAGREILGAILMTDICGGRSFPPAGSSFSMPERTLFEVRDLCRSGRQTSALDQTLRYCPERVSAARLVEGLKTEPKTHSFVLLARRDSAALQHVIGFSVLSSPSGLWALRSTETDGEPWVEVAPTDADGIRQRLEVVIPEPVVVL